VLNHMNGVSLPSEANIEVYPTRVGKGDYITIKFDGTASVQFITMTGRLVSDLITITADGKNPAVIQIPDNVVAGVYILRFIIRDQIYIRRIVVY